MVHLAVAASATIAARGEDHLSKGHAVTPCQARSTLAGRQPQRLGDGAPDHLGVLAGLEGLVDSAPAEPR